MDLFYQSFQTIFMAVLQIFLIAATAGILVRKQIITQDHIKSLSSVTIKVFLPCLIFSKITQRFDPDTFTWWWILPLSAVGIIFTGLFFSTVFFVRNLEEKKNMLPLSSMQNAVYLVLPIGKIVFSNNFDQFALYNFLFAIGISPVLWSLGKYLNTNQKGDGKVKIREFLTPPLFANIIGLTLVFTSTQVYIPQIINDATEMLGNATVPVANFVLGATLGSISLKKFPHWFDTLRVISVKFILVPVVIASILYWLKLEKDFAMLTDFFIMQAASAPATGLILQVRSYGGDRQKIGSMMLICYFVCIIAMPVWVALWRMVF